MLMTTIEVVVYFMVEKWRSCMHTVMQLHYKHKQGSNINFGQRVQLIA